MFTFIFIMFLDGFSKKFIFVISFQYKVYGSLKDHFTRQTESLDGIGICCNNLMSVSISVIVRFTVDRKIIIIVIRIDKCYAIK